MVDEYTHQVAPGGEQDQGQGATGGARVAPSLGPLRGNDVDPRVGCVHRLGHGLHLDEHLDSRRVRRRNVGGGVGERMADRRDALLQPKPPAMAT